MSKNLTKQRDRNRDAIVPSMVSQRTCYMCFGLNPEKFRLRAKELARSHGVPLMVDGHDLLVPREAFCRAYMAVFKIDLEAVDPVDVAPEPLTGDELARELGFAMVGGAA